VILLIATNNFERDAVNTVNWQSSWLDRMEQVASMGSKRVMLTLSKMSNTKFEIKSNKAKLCSLKEVPTLIQSPNATDMYVSVHVGLNGRLKGKSIIALPWDSAENLDKRLWSPYSVSPNFLSEMSYTGIKELGKIITASYITGLEEYTRSVMMHSVPDLYVSLANTLLEGLVYEYSNKEKFLVSLISKFGNSEYNIEGTIIVFLVSSSVQILIQDKSKLHKKQLKLLKVVSPEECDNHNHIN
jgi:chemotaxis protein CheC